MRIKEIDFLKGYSIFTIVIFHLFQFFPLQGIASKLIYFGGSGVHVFILCSGFGLCLSQLSKPLDYLQFLKKRFFKIYIPYIIVVLISAAIPFLYTYDDKLMAILSHIFLFKMFNETWMGSFGYQLWFISMILQFYLLFPVLFFLVNKFKWKAVIVGFIISLIWATLVGWLGKSEMRIWNSFFLQYIWEFFLGMMLAFKVKENPEYIKIPNTKYLVISAILGITIVFISGIKGGVFKLYNDFPSLLGYLSIALLVFAAGMKLKWINNFFLNINIISYEWYLIHMLVFILVFHFMQNTFPMAIVGILGLALSYGCAVVYHKVLKKIL